MKKIDYISQIITNQSTVMKQALDFLKSNKDIALATVGLDGRPMIRAFQIMKADGL